MLLLALFFAGAPIVADEEENLPLESRVNRAIDRGARHLLSKQAEDGSWQKEDKVHPLGRTALCAFTLLHAGVDKTHPAILEALTFLGVSDGYESGLEPRSTYEAGCLVLLLNALGAGHRGTIHGICQWLCDNFNANAGLWGYPDGTPDLSNTQYAAMALKAGARHGFVTPKGIWKRLIESTVRLQSPTGGMRYRGGSIYRSTMTHAGLLVLRFAHEALGVRTPSRRVREAMEKAHAWLAETYTVETNPHGRGWSHNHYYYYMYGLERYAVFFGKERIAGHDWYREGAEALLARQKKEGSWGNLEQTCFAILFLRRAALTEPVARDGGEDAGEGEGAGPDQPQQPRPDAAVSYLRSWLVAGPFAGTRDEDDHLFLRHLDPKRVKPRDGVVAGRRRWVAYTSNENRVDLAKATMGQAWASYYAAVYLHVADATDVVFWLASDDGLRAYLDGEEILFGHHHGFSGADRYRVPARLDAGRHVLLLHIENLEHYAHLEARISDAKGAPLPRDAVVVSTSTRRR